MVTVLDSPFIDMAVRPGRWNVGPSEGSNLRRRKPTASKGERWQSEEVCNDQIVGAAEAQRKRNQVCKTSMLRSLRSPGCGFLKVFLIHHGIWYSQFGMLGAHGRLVKQGEVRGTKSRQSRRKILLEMGTDQRTPILFSKGSLLSRTRYVIPRNRCS